MHFWKSYLPAGVPILILLMILPIVGQSCGGKRKERKLERFDSIAWKADKDGCGGIRASMKENLLKSKYTMRGLTTREVLDLMGHPDAEELADRNQKYYIYFIEPGPKCSGFTGKATALYVRFSAVGIANEFTFREFTP
jgi:hypothetical protein